MNLDEMLALAVPLAPLRASSDNWFAHAPDGIQATRTSLWARADSTPTQQVWIAPTAARVHDIVSSSANDTSAGSGARTVQVWGLTSWNDDELESTEMITMNGTTPVSTVNSYVVIHRMRVRTNGATGWNEGAISATAQTDSTVTAQMPAGQGQTQLAVRGVPEGWRAFVTYWDAALGKSSGAARDARFSLEDWEMSDPSNPSINIRDEIAVQTNGANAFPKNYPPLGPLRFTGPCIIHTTAIASAADVDGSSSLSALFVKI